MVCTSTYYTDYCFHRCFWVAFIKFCTYLIGRSFPPRRHLGFHDAILASIINTYTYFLFISRNKPCSHQGTRVLFLYQRYISKSRTKKSTTQVVTKTSTTLCGQTKKSTVLVPLQKSTSHGAEKAQLCAWTVQVFIRGLYSSSSPVKSAFLRTGRRYECGILFECNGYSSLI